MASSIHSDTRTYTNTHTHLPLGSTHYLSTPERKASRYSPVMIRDTPDEVERDGVGGASGRGQAEPVVIDLTLSSDEEDDPQPRRSSLR